MKKFSLILTVLCCTWLIGCNKIENEKNGSETTFALKDGGIIINNNPDITVKTLNNFPVGTSTENEFSASRKRLSLRSAKDANGDSEELASNDYRFKLVAEANTLSIDGVETQATHVKITNDAKYAFVSYNSKGDRHMGGIVVYQITILNETSLDKLSVSVNPIAMLEMPKAEVSAVDYYNGKLFITGASEEPKFGYNAETDGYNYAFYMVMSLTSDMKFADVDPFTAKLTSYQGTSIRAVNGRTYITTGDGMKKDGSRDTNGGLYIFNSADNASVKFINDKDHVRSVDADADNVYLMQAEPARITKYTVDGDFVGEIYNKTSEALQKDAKSEMLVWNKYLLVAENESGLRMLDKNGNVNDGLECPGPDVDKDVTNSVAINSDTKKNFQGTAVNSNLLLLANGEKGVYWYDIVKTSSGKDRISACNNNSILAGDGLSANFIASKGNIVFVANGLGGLKILYVGFDPGDMPPPPFVACTDVSQYFNNGISSYFPPSQSVFRNNAAPVVKQLFSDPDAVPQSINVLDDTRLYFSFIYSSAAFKNSLGYFVVPAVNSQSNPMSNSEYFNTITDFYSLSGTTKVLNNKYVIVKNITNGVIPQGTWEIENYQTNNGGFKKGDRVVLFLVPTGWISQNARVEMGSSGWNQVIFMDINLNKKNPALWNEAKNNGAENGFNGIQYNTFYSETCNSLVYFFEDKYTGTDFDYNDIIFSISDDIMTDPNQTTVMKIEKPKYTMTGDGTLIQTQ